MSGNREPRSPLVSGLIHRRIARCGVREHRRGRSTVCLIQRPDSGGGFPVTREQQRDGAPGCALHGDTNIDFTDFEKIHTKSNKMS